MNAKEYLQQLRQMDINICQKEKELADLKIKSTSIGGIDYSKERVKSSASSDATFINPVEKLTDLEKEIEYEITEYTEMKHLMINQIQGLRNAKHVDLLYKRYVEYKRLKMISVEMNYEYQYIKELHGYALQEFERTYPNLP